MSISYPEGLLCLEEGFSSPDLCKNGYYTYDLPTDLPQRLLAHDFIAKEPLQCGFYTDLLAVRTREAKQRGFRFL